MEIHSLITPSLIKRIYAASQFNFYCALTLVGLITLFQPAMARDNIDEPPVDHELGNICYDDGSEVKITPATATWLAKMIDGETWGKPSQEDANAMLWAITQLSAVRKSRGLAIWELNGLTQIYSQPINSKWTKTGSKCRQYYAEDYSGEIPNKCSVKKVNRRAKNINKEWQDTAELARTAVLDFAAGNIPNNVVGAVGWFAPKLWERRELNGSNTEDNSIFLEEISGNVFYSTDRRPDTSKWNGDEVIVVGPDVMCPMIIQPSEKEVLEYER